MCNSADLNYEISPLVICAQNVSGSKSFISHKRTSGLLLHLKRFIYIYIWMWVYGLDGAGQG